MQDSHTLFYFSSLYYCRDFLRVRFFVSLISPVRDRASKLQIKTVSGVKWYAMGTRYGSSGNVVRQIQHELMKHGPLSASLEVYKDFFDYQSGVYRRSPSAAYSAGHTMKLIGWGTENGMDYWFVFFASHVTSKECILFPAKNLDYIYIF